MKNKISKQNSKTVFLERNKYHISIRFLNNNIDFCKTVGKHLQSYDGICFEHKWIYSIKLTFLWKDKTTFLDKYWLSFNHNDFLKNISWECTSVKERRKKIQNREMW